MKIKTNELTRAALDWVVAKCEGLTLHKDAMLNGVVKRGWWVSGMSIDPNTWHPLAMFNPSTDWSQGGPIIEREGIDMLRLLANINNDVEDRGWRAYHTPTREAVTHCYAEGPTPLIAAMRCYVASELGDEVDIPEELL
jgi:hypothetical protein